MNSNKLTSTRKTCNKITNEQRRALIEMVYIKNYSLTEASELLKINYSTSKGILRVFRNEKRVNKKKLYLEDNLEKLLRKNLQETKENSEILTTDTAKDYDSKEESGNCETKGDIIIDFKSAKPAIKVCNQMETIYNTIQSFTNQMNDFNLNLQTSHRSIIELVALYSLLNNKINV
jgi:hypothetical protein